MEFTFQQKERLLFLTTNMAAMNSGAKQSFLTGRIKAGRK